MEIKIQFNFSFGERLCTECKEAARKPVRVRAHFRVVGRRKVFVRAHYRKR